MTPPDPWSTVRAPEGWTVTATTSNHRRSLGADASPGTMWTVLVPEATAAGSYPIRVTTAYAWGPAGGPAAARASWSPRSSPPRPTAAAT
ncbi:NEW3 domain-containing protein [Phytohabitans houttuyneae]|nr:NEW3 domain-containing protein [Phytohabitans houttuyneae]